MKKKINILIVDDSVIFSEGLEQLLSHDSSVNKVLISHDYKRTFEVLKKDIITIVILDLNFENVEYDGFEIAKQIRKLYSHIKIIVLSQHAKVDYYETLINDYKVNGYIDKKLSVNQLFKAVEDVLRNENYTDPIVQNMVNTGRFLKLTKREKEVIAEISKGNTQTQVAETLFISPKTVESHLRHLKERFHVQNTVELVSMYIKYINRNKENYENTTPPFKKI